MANNKGSSSKGCAKGCVAKILGDPSTKSGAFRQMVLGTTTGWLTGVLSTRVGRGFTFAAGSSIILFQVAYQAGYIKVNCDHINKDLQKIRDKVEEKATGSGPNWMDKVERYVDKKVDKAEEKLTQNEKKVKRWYSKFLGYYEPYEPESIHIFILFFAGGLVLGIAAS